MGFSAAMSEPAGATPMADRAFARVDLSDVDPGRDHSS